MSKLIVTKWNDKILTALMIDHKCHSLRLESNSGNGVLGTIYIGKVKNIVKNIGAAFVDLGNGQMGYYSLMENQNHLFADTPFGQNGSPIQRKLREGDEIIVQVSKEAVKTKDPVLSCYLNFTGKYSVLTLGKPIIGFSAKIKDIKWKEEVRNYLSGLKDDTYGIIVRTNAKGLSAEEIGAEVKLLKERMDSLLKKACCRTCFSQLEEALPPYVLSLRDLHSKDLETVVTDDKECFEQLKQFLLENQPKDIKKLCFYEDPMVPLIKLYSLESVLQEASGKRVWLKSGGYLIIEPTEALTVIDVNTGKYSGKKNIEDTILKINLEAAKEAARQIKLRNLSGIIIVDFIDMALPEHRNLLLECLSEEFLKDPVKTVLVDITKLGLVEITRKKVHKPLHELLNEK